jgi:hemerythrin superfamily protein
MNAITLLRFQHRDVERLFSKIEHAKRPRDKDTFFEELAERLAEHAAFEEEQLYPAIRTTQTEDILPDSREEHFRIKCLLAVLLRLDADDETFESKLKVLQEQVEQHVKEQENVLFPKVRQLLGDEELEALGRRLAGEVDRPPVGHPRAAVLFEADHSLSL